MDKLSVIIPAYNAEKYLAQAVESARRQAWPGAFEIVIVDDGSTDGTPALAKALGDTVRTQARGGAAAARNAGIRASTGALLLFLDADDLLTPGALQRLAAPMAASEAVQAVFGRAEDFISPELSAPARAGLQPRPSSYGGVLPGCALLRRAVFDAVGLFDESLKSGETVAWLLRLRDRGLPGQDIDFVTLRRRLHLANTDRLDPRQEMQNYAAILRRRLQGQ